MTGEAVTTLIGTVEGTQTRVDGRLVWARGSARSYLLEGMNGGFDARTR